jgi:hypothetical protein
VRFVVVVRHHVQQPPVAVGRGAAVTEKRLVNLGAVHGKRLMLGAVRTEAAAVLVGVLVARGLVGVPDAAITVGLPVERGDFARRFGRFVREGNGNGNGSSDEGR